MRKLIVLACVVLMWDVAAAELALSGVLGERALLVVDNGVPQLVAVGKSTPSGIRLLSINGNTAVVEYEGRRHTLRLGERAVRQETAKGGRAGVGTLTTEQARKVLARGVELSIEADEMGQFVTDGEINGRAVRFLVDTGASSVAIGRSTALAMGIEIDDKQADKAHTAGGVVGAWRVKLRSMKVGTIHFEHVDAVVMETNMPNALLGMNVLGQMEMRRDGRQMKLKKKL